MPGETQSPEVDLTAAELERDLRDARRRTLDLVLDLSDDQLMGPRLAIVNPLVWEIGHLAWFQANWVLRDLRGLPLGRSDADSLYDSFKVAHDTRWDLPLPARTETLRYMETELERAIELLHARPLDGKSVYFHRLVLFHEDMHDEAFTYTRQSLGYPAPRFTLPLPSEPAASASPAASSTPDHRAAPATAMRTSAASAPPATFPSPAERAASISGTIDVPGGTFVLGATRGEPFVFDNEKWGHPVELRPFRICRTAVTDGEFAAFVEDGGYDRRELWGPEGWAWRESMQARHPLYWRRAHGGWERRVFDRWQPLVSEHAVLHVNWYEASAYCRWAGKRLPSEAEWEAASSSVADGARVLGATKRPRPWGDAPATPERANLDGTRLGVVAAEALPGSDSAFGCRQMWGNVWEWTSSVFGPYPGFVADPYKEYSLPWFDGRHMVLRGGCWATRARLLRNTWRNFYTRERRDVFAGFRTCDP